MILMQDRGLQSPLGIQKWGEEFWQETWGMLQERGHVWYWLGKDNWVLTGSGEGGIPSSKDKKGKNTNLHVEAILMMHACVMWAV